MKAAFIISSSGRGPMTPG
ncbi:hypothetical protein EYF80_061964 [Liparis tanakae]|uniref:Uncharacterized protein n=1 Tax=Liparis tanakae TaxID=230148 RepID=A0A4Z2EG72_9TELE|nr:hypothetical protein EYF80_061964 [Liparis tanakae]